MNIITLSQTDREFFMLVSDAVFLNPFSRERELINEKLAGGKGETNKNIVAHAIKEVARRIELLDKQQRLTIENFGQRDRELMEHVFLFNVFHKFIQQFDSHIEKQLAAGDEPIDVPFGKEVIRLLAERGFGQQLLSRYFALFFQLRRAFHFIIRSLIGQCPSMRELRMNLWNNIFTHDIRHYERYLWDRMEDFSTLFLGPTGCGKGAAAAAIGKSGFIPFDEKKQCFSDSFTKLFIPVNLAEFPQMLIESELFGHTKGAFTGAVSSHEGLFAQCGSHGSIFMDEIGEVSPQVQVKLLTVLQERVFCPVGSNEKLRFKGRVIAATNRSIEQLRGKGRFRDDFYYRLCSDCITVPSLKQRIEENPQELKGMIAHTVERITGKKSEELTEIVAEVIDRRLGKSYAWPGNVRELAQCVRRVIIKRDYGGDIPEAHNTQEKLFLDFRHGNLTAEELLGGYCTMIYKQCRTYEEVARRTGLDRRTVKKYIQSFVGKG